MNATLPASAPTVATETDRDVLIAELMRALEPLRESGLVVQLIGDYPPGDPASAKMATALKESCPESCKPLTFLPIVAVPSLDTARGGFATAMLSMAPEHLRGKNVLFYLNVAPITKRDSRNGSHPFCVALLTNGAVVFTPNAGHSLSMLKPYIRALFVLTCDTGSKQFRSWQCFPPVIGQLLSGNTSVIHSVIEQDMDIIPELPETHVIDLDSFGNARTPLTRGQLEEAGLVWGEPAVIRRNGIRIAHAIFGDPKGPRSAGDTSLSIKEGSNLIVHGLDFVHETFLDVFSVGGNAARLCVLDVERYPVGLRGSLSEACAVGLAAYRSFGAAEAAKGFVGVMSKRRKERRDHIGEYEREAPKIEITRV